MSYTEYIANANTAFGGGEYGLAVEYAQKAIKEEPKEIDGYVIAGKSYISMANGKEAEEYLKKAAAIRPNDGTVLFLLGYAQTIYDNIPAALRTLTRSLEVSRDDAIRGQIYKIISMINTNQGDFKNALINVEQAEECLGNDYEILRLKVACYTKLNDFHQAFFVLNQMKLLQPANYLAYSIAFNMLMELGMHEEAKAELERAKKYSDLPMLYYNDSISYILLSNPDQLSAEDMRERLMKAQKTIDEGLRSCEVTAHEVFDYYLRAAQNYISLNNPNEAVRVLDAAGDPIGAYNSGFSIVRESEIVSKDEPMNEQGLSAEDEEALMQERWDNGELSEISEAIEDALMNSGSVDSEDISNEVEAYLTPLDAIPAESSKSETRTLLHGDFEMSQYQKDKRNSLYVSAYELLEEYDKMFSKARELQASSVPENQYAGIYYELRVGKLQNKENWEKKYKERINYWTKCMLENPMDFASATYRIKAYIDIGDYENANTLCDCLPQDVRGALKEEIEEARKKEGKNDGTKS